MQDVVLHDQAPADQLGICHRDIAVVDQELLLEPAALPASVDLAALLIVAQVKPVDLGGVLIFLGDPAHNEVDILPAARFEHSFTHIGVDPVIPVHEHDPFAPRRQAPRVAGTAQTSVLLVDDPDPLILRRIFVADAAAVVRRPVIDEQDLDLLKGLGPAALHALAQKTLRDLIDRHNDAHLRSFFLFFSPIHSIRPIC